MGHLHSVAAALLSAVALLLAPSASNGAAVVDSDGMERVGGGNFCASDVSHGTSQRGAEHRLTWHSGDIAFWGDRAIAACGAEDRDLENDGFTILDISDGAQPRKIGEMQCVASASDVQVWGDLVFLAVDRNGESSPPPNPGPLGTGCQAEPIDRNAPASGGIFHGVRVVSIADPTAPQVVANVRLDPRGAHTISVLPDLGHTDGGAPAPRVLVYAASPLGPPGGTEPGRIIAVPLARPQDAASIAAFEATSYGCHDIALFEPRGLAVCTGVDGGSLIYDIRDDPADARDDGASPVAPRKIAAISAVGAGRDHGAAFSWDGDVLVIGDEGNAALAGAACTPLSVLWFYDVRDPHAPRRLSAFSHPPSAGNVSCHAKHIGVMPLLDGRDVAVVSWLGGGTTLVDFTRIAHPDPDKRRPPRQIAHWTASQESGDGAFVWAAYWYNGFVYANHSWGCLAASVHCVGTKVRGLDVFSLDDPELSAAASLPRFNYPTQECLPAQGWSPGELAACGSP